MIKNEKSTQQKKFIFEVSHRIYLVKPPKKNCFSKTSAQRSHKFDSIYINNFTYIQNTAC